MDRPRLALLLLLAAGCFKPSLPGRSHLGALPAPDDELLASAARIRDVVKTLAADIGPRSFAYQPEALDEAAQFIEATWQEQGFVVERQLVVKRGPWVTANLWVRIPGAGPPLVVGAHYDTVSTSPGADDNASGVAALLELTRAYRPPVPDEGREVVFIAWTTEEPPYFTSASQGSAVHAAAHEVHSVIALDTIGTYHSEPGTQSYPFPLRLFYPRRGDFLAFVSKNGDRSWVKEVARDFRAAEPFPTRGGTAPRWIPGISWSDHRSYWPQGAPALMLTDTALYRNEHYHEPDDLPDTVDPEAIARVVRGLVAVVATQRAALASREALATGTGPAPR